MSAKRSTSGIQHRRSLAAEPGGFGWRHVAGAAVVVAVLGAGMILGFGDFLGRPEADTTGAMPVRMSMAGFEPQVITAKAGTDLKMELWTTDAAIHLEGGVHTMISDQLGIYEELPAESRRTVTIRMPMTPGDYDIYCDTCCGGKDSPAMHGKLRVTA
jgi:cytochrome c oxidase subunit II